jgi:stress response protein YsnF
MSTRDTGVPMIDLFLQGWSTMVDVQRAMMGAGQGLSTANAGGMPLVREVSIGATEQRVIPVLKEELRIGKRPVQSAKAYRISTHVVEVPVEQPVNLRAETVAIERRPATGTTVRGGETFQNQTIEVHELYEEPVVSKVVTNAEEVVIYKTLSERTAVVRDTVRETRVSVEERTGPTRIEARAVEEFEAELRAAAGDKPLKLSVINDDAQSKRHADRKDHTDDENRR